DLASGLTAERADTAGWWRCFDDPVLDGLVARANDANLDVKEALARVHEARALRGATAADQFPTLDASASYARRAESKNTPFGDFVPDSDNFALGFDASWEIDLVGRVKRSIEAADATVQATIEYARDVAVTVTAEVARNYVELRSFQRRLAIAKNNVSLQEQTLELVRGRQSAGLVGERDVAQALSNVETTRSRVPTLEVGVRAAENRLAVLLGRSPGALAAELGTERAIPVPPASVAVGVPADLLRRRADVRRAERELAAEHARIGVAEGDLYPKLTLAGDVGLAADQLSKLFESQSIAYGYGPTLRWNLFDAGRLKNRVAAQEARTEQAFVKWERTVLIALEETENAMTAFVREQVRRQSLLSAAREARRAVDLSRAQYTEGLEDFQNVLVSERSVTDLEDELAASDAAIATQLVALYKALGGAWDGVASVASR
ncbi:MAG: efflux transporter outer membrane subunit, partial [Planctomycetota bacterium]|nr:efflux transporter outer membrane subunit [Planctomycetota bacterium]